MLDLKSPMDPALSTVVAGMNHVAGEAAVNTRGNQRAPRRATAIAAGL